MGCFTGHLGPWPGKPEKDSVKPIETIEEARSEGKVPPCH